MSRRSVAALVFVAACGFAAWASGAPPNARPDPIASASTAPVASATPASPAPSPTPTILMLPPDAAPQILWYQFSSTTPHAGDTVTVIVLCSSNVASLEIRVGSFSFNLPKTDVGRFEGSYVVPHLPFMMSHKLALTIVARNTAGDAAQDSLEMRIL
ncbi:MAG TPA: hypothetical protein VGX91_12890 [Candidatus Cybelea sp.]|nr:hypothetical protein [Candidatus Cybelea sp.]